MKKRKRWMVTLAVQYDQLWPRQSVLGDLTGLATRQIDCRFENHGLAIRWGEDGRAVREKREDEPVQNGRCWVAHSSTTIRNRRQMVSGFHSQVAGRKFLARMLYPTLTGGDNDEV